MIQKNKTTSFMKSNMIMNFLQFETENPMTIIIIASNNNVCIQTKNKKKQ